MSRSDCVPAVQELWPKMYPCKERFFVARCHLLAALYLNVSRTCATCRIMETRESVQKFAPSPKNHVKNHVLGCTAAGVAGRSPPPCSRTFASTLVTLQICGLIIVVDVDLVTLASLSRVKKSGRFQFCFVFCFVFFTMFTYPTHK